MKDKIKKRIPFDFVFDYLHPLVPAVKPMFGCHSLYLGEKIILILREKDEHTEDNGVWIATDYGHHESLRKKIPSLRRIFLFGNKETAWQNIPSDSVHFEKEVIHACELIRKTDERIGRIPKKKKK